jgi:hypothetical protein
MFWVSGSGILLATRSQEGARRRPSLAGGLSQYLPSDSTTATPLVFEYDYDHSLFVTWRFVCGMMFKQHERLLVLLTHCLEARH